MTVRVPPSFALKRLLAIGGMIMLVCGVLVWGLGGARPVLAQDTAADAPDSPATRLRIIMVTHAGPGDPFWEAEFRGAADTARALGVDLTILAPDRPNDFIRQLDLLTDAIEAAPDGIATTVSHPTAFGPLLKDAQAHGIPVLAFNARPLHDDQEANPYLAFVGMDDYRAGHILATQILERGGVPLQPASRSRVVVAMQQVGLTGLESRFLAIQTVFAEKGVIVDKLDVGTSPDTARQVFRAYMQTHDAVQAVITLGPAATHPIGRIIVQDSLPVYFAAFDLSPLTVRLITDGILDFTIDQQPYMQGSIVVLTLVMTARYAMIPPDVDTGITIIDASTVDRVIPNIRDGVR